MAGTGHSHADARTHYRLLLFDLPSDYLIGAVLNGKREQQRQHRCQARNNRNGSTGRARTADLVINIHRNCNVYGLNVKESQYFFCCPFYFLCVTEPVPNLSRAVRVFVGTFSPSFSARSSSCPFSATGLEPNRHLGRPLRGRGGAAVCQSIPASETPESGWQLTCRGCPGIAPLQGCETMRAL
jgi:hypothetical protein